MPRMPSGLSMAEKRARNRSLTSMLWTPPAYGAHQRHPGYSSCLGSLTRVQPSGIITFVPYGREDDSPPPYVPQYDGPSSFPVSKSTGFPYHTPPLCSPEDDSDIQDDIAVVRKTSPNTISSGYGSADSDQDLNVPMSQSYCPRRSSRYQTRRGRETEKWRRRSVPAAIRPNLPDDLVKVLDGYVKWETNVDTGERFPMVMHDTRRHESVMELARRFGEIGAAQENDIHRSRTSLESKENRSAAVGAMAGRPNIFKQMEKVGPGTAGPPKQFNPNSIKEALLRWVQNKVQDYPNVNVTNFSSSWADGMAFCALIHRFAPHAFDFNQLKPEERRKNFELAFRVAEENGICPLLEVDDMLIMGDRPDWKSVFCYVQCFYKRFNRA